MYFINEKNFHKYTINSNFTIIKSVNYYNKKGKYQTKILNKYDDSYIINFLNKKLKIDDFTKIYGDYITNSSCYFFSKKLQTIVRASDHWGSNIRTCNWWIRNLENQYNHMTGYTKFCEQYKKIIFAKTKLSDFSLNLSLNVQKQIKSIQWNEGDQ